MLSHQEKRRYSRYVLIVALNRTVRRLLVYAEIVAGKESPARWYCPPISVALRRLT